MPKKNLLKKSFFLVLSAFFMSCFLALPANASRTKGYAFATVLKANISISDVKQSEFYEIERKDVIGQNLGISYTISSEPNTVLEVFFKVNNSPLFSGGDEILFIDLKNNEQEVVKLKLKTGDNKIYFDRNGKGVLNVNPEFGIITDVNGLQGTYKATYDIVIFS
jgi:YbbR domain-containing protein